MEKISAKQYLVKLAESLEECIDKENNTLTMPGDFAREVAESLHKISEAMIR